MLACIGNMVIRGLKRGAEAMDRPDQPVCGFMHFDWSHERCVPMVLEGRRSVST